MLFMNLLGGSFDLKCSLGGSFEYFGNDLIMYKMDLENVYI